jgi:hypothetical protein
MSAYQLLVTMLDRNLSVRGRLDGFSDHYWVLRLMKGDLAHGDASKVVRVAERPSPEDEGWVMLDSLHM